MLKRLISCLLLVVIILFSASGVMAATIYLDGTVGAQMDNTLGKWDYNPIYAGVDIPLGNWKISAEYTPETKWWQNIEQVSGYTIKGGYSFVNNDNVRIGLNLGVYYQNFNGPTYYYRYNNDTTIGLDGSFKLSNKFKLDLSYDNFLSGNAIEKYSNSTTTTTYDIKTLQTGKIKCTYLFNQNWGISLGYRSIIEQANGWNKFTFGGANLGLLYQF